MASCGVSTCLYDRVQNDEQISELDYFQQLSIVDTRKSCASMGPLHMSRDILVALNNLTTIRLSLFKPTYDSLNDGLFKRPHFLERLGSFLIDDNRFLAFEAREVVVIALGFCLRRRDEALLELLLSLVLSVSSAVLDGEHSAAAVLAAVDLVACCLSRHRLSGLAGSSKVVQSLLPAFKRHWTHAFGGHGINECSQLQLLSVARALRKVARHSQSTVGVDEQLSSYDVYGCAVLDALEELILNNGHDRTVANVCISCAPESRGSGRSCRRGNIVPLALPSAEEILLSCLIAAYKHWGSPTTRLQHCGRLSCLSRHLLLQYIESGTFWSRAISAETASSAHLPGEVVTNGQPALARFRLLAELVLHASSHLLVPRSPTVFENDVIVAAKAIARVDREAQIVLGEKRPLWWWLVELFLHEDDVLVNALLCLLNIHLAVAKWCSCADNLTSATLADSAAVALLVDATDSHKAFMRLLMSTAYDHCILLDWLISPETRFLAFFVKYSKHLVASQDTLLERASCVAAELTRQSADVCQLSGARATADVVQGSLAALQAAYYDEEMDEYDAQSEGSGNAKNAITNCAGTLIDGLAKTLTSLRRSLESMHRSGIFPYNAAPLLRVLNDLHLTATV